MNKTLDDLIIERLGKNLSERIAELEVFVAKSSVYNEILLEQNKQLQSEIDSLKEQLEKDETGGSEDEVEGE